LTSSFGLPAIDESEKQERLVKVRKFKVIEVKNVEKDQQPASHSYSPTVIIPRKAIEV
jgi:hypothetical protein